MRRYIVLPVAAVLLAGCSELTQTFAGQSMMTQSDDCRARAMQAEPEIGPVGETSSSERKAKFDSDYRACMEGKGYPVGQVNS